MFFEGLCVADCLEPIKFMAKGVSVGQGFAECPLTSSLTGLLINTRRIHTRSNYCTVSVCLWSKLIQQIKPACLIFASLSRLPNLQNSMLSLSGLLFL